MTTSELTEKAESNEKWGLIPSDPAVFDDMIQQYGVKDTIVQEVLTLDFEDLEKNGPVHGLIFISRYVEEELPSDFEKIDPDAEKVVFTAQVVTNVCGTLALLAVLFNADIERGEILNNFLEFTKGFSPVNRGICLGNSSEIHKIHDAYAIHNSQLEIDDTLSDVSEDGNIEFIDVDDFHYITYIYKDGYLWELDGLKYQPVKVATCNKDNWLDAVKPILQKRMDSSAQNELTFSLMAVTQDMYPCLLRRKDAYDKCIALTNGAFNRVFAPSTISKKKKACHNLLTLVNSPDAALMSDIWNSLQSGNTEFAKIKLEDFKQQAEALNNQLQLVKEQRDTARIDAERQKFDYTPFINSLLTKAYYHQLLEDNSRPKKRSRLSKS
ncbi:Ubiquitin carboxyl-terminal hydrolase isozyme L5 [Choanephora cucurbitarum]|uniref:Ubiquitin carboxyl-terminal hydrolase n=1 Tax=Choanephora cucurbitarum TaxID=101091 RepID=A0A1C7NJT2_9FUNG|nr:Ubiquitin carboxyl-terminal hydrolase isozyme L5 [Choanephora cucurbitarum]